MAQRIEVVSWGANSHGQLGQSHTEDVRSPQKITNLSIVMSAVTSVTGGGGHTLLLLDDGQAFSCGNNEKGQLGLGSEEQHITTFHPISELHGHVIKHVACGWDFSLAVTATGDVYSWGSNSYGQLGQPIHFKCSTRPQLIKRLSTECVLAVAAGLRHAGAVTVSGEVWCWGNGKKGQLGISPQQHIGDAQIACDTLEKIDVPQKVSLDVDGKICKLFCGSFSTLALSDRGKLYGWGSNTKGQLALDPSVVKETVKPQKLPLENISGLHSGWTHVVARTSGGKLLSWGRGDYGQLGRSCPEKGFCWEPQEVEELPSVIQVCGGSEHNMALTSGNMLWSWGWNEHNMCGFEEEVNIHRPTPISSLKNKEILLAGCGAGHSFAFVNMLKEDP
ncbi:secretion-regulating guanine nucleotide exchange factor-like isoform X1 [Limulus polyphemus]|uniref:Secretion-regulating guanine nucleotide exchange factor-like isoform X1 n=1 Tax=Limulus polyphemus TaxID=6850 RepID=A0ABM1TKL1_LIMPO|nr:secretion-regulating guanine nucleotide exchange factor-like isoform X1 [Limulus polyphemus]